MPSAVENRVIEHSNGVIDLRLVSLADDESSGFRAIKAFEDWAVAWSTDRALAALSRYFEENPAASLTVRWELFESDGTHGTAVHVVDPRLGKLEYAGGSDSARRLIDALEDTVSHAGVLFSLNERFERLVLSRSMLDDAGRTWFGQAWERRASRQAGQRLKAALGGPVARAPKRPRV